MDGRGKCGGHASRAVGLQKMHGRIIQLPGLGQMLDGPFDQMGSFTSKHAGQAADRRMCSTRPP
jgi:hypothetical protein